MEGILVAKTYQNFEFIDDIFHKNGKQYIKAKNPKTGAVKEIRVYSEREYNKMYNKTPVEKEWHFDESTQKIALGFSSGYINLLPDGKIAGARKNVHFGWYLPGDEAVPEGVTAKRLDWFLVGKEDGSLRTEKCIKDAIDSLSFEQVGEYVGSVKERLELTLTVEKNLPMASAYGTQNFHIMKDENGNTFIWSTASQRWDEGTTHHIKGTVKEHKTFRGVKETVLVRCKEV